MIGEMIHRQEWFIPVGRPAVFNHHGRDKRVPAGINPGRKGLIANGDVTAGKGGQQYYGQKDLNDA